MRPQEHLVQYRARVLSEHLVQYAASPSQWPSTRHVDRLVARLVDESHAQVIAYRDKFHACVCSTKLHSLIRLHIEWKPDPSQRYTWTTFDAHRPCRLMYSRS